VATSIRGASPQPRATQVSTTSPTPGHNARLSTHHSPQTAISRADPTTQARARPHQARPAPRSSAPARLHQARPAPSRQAPPAASLSGHATKETRASAASAHLPPRRSLDRAVHLTRRLTRPGDSLDQATHSTRRLTRPCDSTDPELAAKKAESVRLYAIAGGQAQPREPEAVICIDELGPLNLQQRPGRPWAAISGTQRNPGANHAENGRDPRTAPIGSGICSRPTTWAATDSTGRSRSARHVRGSSPGTCATLLRQVVIPVDHLVNQPGVVRMDLIRETGAGDVLHRPRRSALTWCGRWA